jgi:hypothetical protein
MRFPAINLALGSRKLTSTSAGRPQTAGRSRSGLEIVAVADWSWLFPVADVEARPACPPRRPSPRTRDRRRATRGHVPLMEGCEPRVVLSTSTWIGGAHFDSAVTSGSPTAWSNPLNWLGGVPTAGATAEFTDNVTFSLANHNFNPKQPVGTGNEPTITYHGPFNESPQADFNDSAAINVDSSWDGNITVESGVTLTLVGASQWNGGSSLTVTAGTLTNGGTLTVNTSDGSSALFSGTLNNDGTLTVQDSGKSVGVFDGGTINNQSQGIINVSGIDDGGYPLLDTTVNNTGTINATSTATVTIRALSNMGLVVVQAGTLGVDGAYTETGTSSQKILDGGTFDPSGGTIINGGTVTGSGTIDGNVINAAVFEPGTASAGGTIAITGNYTQTSAGTLDIGLGGTAAGQFGQLAVAGNANLNGTLNIIRLQGFVPTSTNVFPVVTYGSHTGTFPTVTGTTLPNNQTLSTSYTSSGLTLGVTDDD